MVFCLYAEDAGLFDRNDCHIFGNYIKNTETKNIRKALIELFEVLRVTLTIGFFWWLITDFSDVLGTLFEKFGQWGVKVANLKKSGPADIVNAGTDVALKLMNPEGSVFNLTKFCASIIGI